MHVSGSFQVTDGGNMDIDVTIKQPSGDLVFEANRETTGKFSFEAKNPGLYSFCFSNRMSTMTAKQVRPARTRQRKRRTHPPCRRALHTDPSRTQSGSVC